MILSGWNVLPTGSTVYRGAAEMQNIIRSLRVLTEKGIHPADIVLDEGIIVRQDAYGTHRHTFDFGHRLIAPGLVDLHSDAVETEVEPRPGAHFPLKPALVELDKKLAMAGITTMFHAIGFNDAAISPNRGTERAATIIQSIHEVNTRHLYMDNLVHARYEITSFPSIPVIQDLIEVNHIDLLSIMDHTPGQGQFRSIENWKKFHMPVYGLSNNQADEIITQKQRDHGKALQQTKQLVNHALDHALILLSHDDDTEEKVDVLFDLGIRISEFPLKLEVANYARERGFTTGMGAPNIVRGRSQNGNVSARELVSAGACDFLCSDYHPTSLLQAPYVMAAELGVELAKGFAMVTSIPASIAGLTDRGLIAPGRIADLLIIDDSEIPKVVVTMKEGDVVYSSLSCMWY